VLGVGLGIENSLYSSLYKSLHRRNEAGNSSVSVPVFSDKLGAKKVFLSVFYFVFDGYGT